MKLILLGAPGAGKGTQAELLRQRLNVPVISTGGILRAEVEAGSELGRKAKSFMDAGALVPDELIMDIMTRRLREPDCANGFILDGVPRTVAQAQALERSGLFDGVRVLLIEAPDSEIEARLTGRRVCAACNAPYHLQVNPPKREGTCDFCGGELMVRKDDKPETVRHRLSVYHQETAPLIDFYESRRALHMVHTQPVVEETTALVFRTLEIPL